MTLKEYLQVKGLYYRDVAKDLGVNRVYFNAILNGAAKPGARLCVKIEQYTQGFVTFRELRPDIFK